MVLNLHIFINYISYYFFCYITFTTFTAKFQTF